MTGMLPTPWPLPPAHAKEPVGQQPAQMAQMGAGARPKVTHQPVDVMKRHEERQGGLESIAYAKMTYAPL